MPEDPPSTTPAPRTPGARPRRPRRWLRIMAWSLTGALAAFVGLYWHFTRPARLRAVVLELLQRVEHTRASIGAISFSPVTGLEIGDLELRVADDSPLRAALAPDEQGTLMQISYARIQFDPLTLVLGRIQPSEVLLRGATVNVLRDLKTGALNWSLGPGPDENYRATGGPLLPRIRLEQADLNVMTVENGRSHLVRRWVVSATGNAERSAAARAPQTYVIRVRREAGAAVDPLEAQSAQFAELRIEPDTFEASLAAADLNTVRQFLGPAIEEVIAPWQPSGMLAVDRLVLRNQRVAAAKLRLSSVRGVVPVEPDRPAEQRFLPFRDGAATLSFERNEDGRGAALRLVAQALLRDTHAEVTLTSALRAAEDAATLKQPGQNTQPPRMAAADYTVEFLIDGLDCPTRKREGAFLDSPRLPDALRAFFSDYEPNGKIRLRGWVDGQAQLGTNGAPIFEGEPGLRFEMEPLGTSLRYFRFPYLLSDAHGFLRFDRDGFVLDGMHARHGAGRVRCDGRVSHTRPWTAFDLQFRGDAIALDADLYAALPPEYQALWSKASPIGMADVFVTLQRKEGSPEGGALSPDINVDARLLAGSLTTEDGRRLTNTDGLITVSNGTVWLHDIHGYDGDASVRLSGRIGSEAGNGDVDLHVEATDVPVQREARLPSGDGADAGSVRFDGRADVWGRIRGGGLMRDTLSRYAVHIRDGVLGSFDPAAPWRDVQGWLTLAGPELRVVSFSARGQQAWLRAAGLLREQTPQQPLQLDIDAGGPAIDQLLTRLTPPRWASTAGLFGLSGTGKLTARLRPGPAADGAAGQSLEIHAEAQQALPRAMPLKLRDVIAHATLAAGSFDLHEATAAWGAAGTLTLRGQGEWAEELKSAALQATAHGLEFAPELIDALPADFARLLRRMSPRGAFDLNLEQVQFTSGAAGPTWKISGEVALRDVALNLGLSLTEITGALAGSVTVTPGAQPVVNATFTIERGRLAGRPIERWEGQLVREGAERRVQLRDVRGKLCGGEIVGFAQIDAESSDYELSMILRGVNMDQFLQRGDRTGDGQPAGQLDGHVFLRGRAGDESGRRGGGEMRLSGSSFVRMPVLRLVAEAGRKKDPTISDTLDAMTANFVWEGWELKFTRAEIQSRDLRLVGEGSWNISTDRIQLTLVGANPRDWPRIALLSDLVESAGQELMQYRVEGTAESPRVAAEPLHNLTDPLRKLLKP